MEQFLYEVRPFAFLGLGLWSLTYGKDSKLAAICGIVLVILAALIIYSRLKNRGVIK
jgi:hypothetical protein